MRVTLVIISLYIYCDISLYLFPIKPLFPSPQANRSLFLLYIAVTPPAHLFRFCVFQVFFHSYVNKVSLWLPIFLVISNDVHFNPGLHFQNNVFNFMTWNANSLATDNFERIRLVQAHNSILNYDIISICETSLNDSVELPETLLND